MTLRRSRLKWFGLVHRMENSQVRWHMSMNAEGGRSKGKPKALGGRSQTKETE